MHCDAATNGECRPVLVNFWWLMFFYRRAQNVPFLLLFRIFRFRMNAIKRKLRKEKPNYRLQTVAKLSFISFGKSMSTIALFSYHNRPNHMNDILSICHMRFSLWFCCFYSILFMNTVVCFVLNAVICIVFSSTYQPWIDLLCLLLLFAWFITDRTIPFMGF